MACPSLTSVNDLETVTMDAFIWQFLKETNLALNGLRSSIKEKPEHYEFLTFNQLLQKAFAMETNLKGSREIHRSHCPNMHAIKYHLDSSEDEGETNECCFVEFIWFGQNKSVTCLSPKLIHMNRQEDMKVTFDPAKCDLAYLMSRLKLGTLNCHMLCHHLKI